MAKEQVGVETSSSYKITARIKNIDLSQNIMGIRIVSSVAGIYPIIVLSFFVDQNDIILSDLYGKDPIYVDITMLREDGEPRETHSLELIYLKNTLALSPKMAISDNSQIDRSPVIINTVPRQAFRTMTNLVNDVYLGKDIQEIISSLINEINTTLELDTQGIKTQKIDQVVIPPCTLNKAIEYLDYYFGLYQGPLVKFCNLSNTLEIFSLHEQMKKAPVLNLFYLATDEKKDIIEQCIEKGIEKNFYAYRDIRTSYSGNSKLSNIASDVHYISHPRDDLYRVVDKNVETTLKNYGVVTKANCEIEKDDKSDRDNYQIDYTYYENDDTFGNIPIVKKLSNLATVNLDVERNFPIENVLKVGRSVNFNPRTVEYGNLGGKYILWSSDINFEKSSSLQWESTCGILLARTNRKNTKDG